MFNFAFNSFYEALYMNGHGLYVWSVVILVLISLLGFFIGYTVKIKKIKDNKITTKQKNKSKMILEVKNFLKHFF